AAPAEEPVARQVDRDERHIVHIDFYAEGGVVAGVHAQQDGGAADVAYDRAGLAQDAAFDELGDETGDGGLVQSGLGGQIGAGAPALGSDLTHDVAEIVGAHVREV